MSTFHVRLIFLSTIAVAMLRCSTTAVDESHPTLLPMSDPANEGGWVLNAELSDEFEAAELDRKKWFVQGEHGDYYIWKGRAPAQFVPHNVRLEDGKLKLRTQWEPDYDFVDEEYAGAWYGKYDNKPMPVTTAGVITNKRFLNGYMEIKSRAGDACITAAFWAIGYEQELDIFEQMGRPKLENNIRENWSKSTVHDWSPPAVRPTRVFEYTEKLPYRVADEFHVYGAEWGVDYLKIFLDGQLIYEVTQDEVGLDWVLNNPMEIWLDSEIFRWLGMPDPDELPVDFEIEYLRVWQKPESNLLDRAFYGFEGPLLYEQNERPLTLVPESSVPDDYQKFWLIDSLSQQFFQIVEGRYHEGVNSLEFKGLRKNQDFEVEQAIVRSPKGALHIPAGERALSFMIWMDQGRMVDTLHLHFANPAQTLVVDLSQVPRRQWYKVEETFSRIGDSGPDDQFTIEVKKQHVPEIRACRFYLDDFRVSK